MLEQYNKPALSFEDQLSLLEQRGMLISDRASALIKLKNIGYYRLSGYWYPFRFRDNTLVTHNFVPNTSFESIISLYEFDRKLRSFVLDAIERIEVSVRTQVTYHMSHKYGAFAHADANNFHPKFDHRTWLYNLQKETKRSKEEFIRHYRAKYSGFPCLPIWMVTEVMSFGSLSYFYAGLNNNQKLGVEDKKSIASYYNVHHKRLGDWLHMLTYIRNVCAHHSRLWNREFAIKPDKSNDPNWQPPITPRNDRLFYILLILRFLLKQMNKGDHWANEITSLIQPIASNPNSRIAMGLPENWKDHPIWK